MSSTLLKYLLVFLCGGITSYLVLFDSEKNIPSPAALDTSLTKNPTIPNETLTVNEPVSNAKITNNDTSDLVCEEQTKQLEKQRVESEQIQTELKKTFEAQFTEIAHENAILKHKLSMLEPSDVNDDDLKKLIPAPHNLALMGLPPKLKQDISDFHQQAPDLDWGYQKQQQLTDFISTHTNSEYISLTSIKCKIDQCEIILDELINPESMVQQGLDGDEIQTITDTQQPKYKQIFDDMLTTPALNIMAPLYMPNRFGIYMLIKEKTASN
jgi:hypothetical protein